MKANRFIQLFLTGFALISIYATHLIILRLPRMTNTIRILISIVTADRIIVTCI